MAHIAIFCDGTWNSARSEAPTHVLRLSQLCAQSVEQKVVYLEGVGTGTGRISDAGRWLSKWGGGLFGWGLNRNIKTAYQTLCETYQPGDKIMIFGFSRGAYTARSLCGLIRKCGILDHPTPPNLARAFRLYRMRGEQNGPDTPHMRAARQKLSPRFATSQADVLARGDDSYLVRIAFLGVWDTVGALGVPESLLGGWARWWNARYAFHDTNLSHLVESARHAVALDERRQTYAPSLWDNLDAGATGQGLNRGDQSPNRPYQQVWFVGTHSIVGGSAKTRPLTELTLDWIWRGASEQGLRLRPGVTLPQTTPDPMAPISEIDGALGWPYRVLRHLLRWRAGPDHPRDLHDSARRRVAGGINYGPGSLAQLMPGLSRLDDAAATR